jgi:hypothetical protein
MRFPALAALLCLAAAVPCGASASLTGIQGGDADVAAESPAVPDLPEVAAQRPMGAVPADGRVRYDMARAGALLDAVGRGASVINAATSGVGSQLLDDELLVLTILRYEASAEPDAFVEGSDAVTVRLVPIPISPEKSAELCRTDLLVLQRSILEETQATLASMQAHRDARSTATAWRPKDWARGADMLESLWLARQLPALHAGGWLVEGSAMAELEDAVRRAPRSAVLWVMLAEAQLRRGLPQQCADSCSEALRLHPRFSRANYLRGLAMWRLQHVALAEDDLDRSLKSGPYGSTRDEMARRYRARGALRLLRDDKAGMCEDMRQACVHGDCEGLKLMRQQGRCREDL